MEGCPLWNGRETTKGVPNFLSPWRLASQDLQLCSSGGSHVRDQRGMDVHPLHALRHWGCSPKKAKDERKQGD